MPNFGENTRDFLQFPIYYYDVVYSMSLPVRGYAGAASVLLNGWDPIALAPSLAHVSAAGALSVEGTVTATSGATATAAAPSYVEGSTDALSMDLAGNLRVTTGASGGLTDAQLRATPVPVSGTVATGGLTDTQLRATPIPVSGTVTATTGDLTDTQLRATPVPVSGTVTATTGGLTDDELRASAVLVYVDPTTPVNISDDAQRITNMLLFQALQIARAGPNGFVPIETPAFLAC